MPFADYVRAAVVELSGLALDPAGHPGAGMHGSLDDVLAVGRELFAPRLVAAETHAEMTTVHRLDGVLPDFGRFRPLDWGSASSSRARRRANGPQHLGADVRPLRREQDLLDRPGLGVACAALTTRDFGDWAKDAWFSDHRSSAPAVSSRRRRRAAAGARRTSRGRSSPPTWRHRRDGRRARHAHRERHLAEPVARPDHPARPTRSVHPGHAREHDVEALPPSRGDRPARRDDPAPCARRASSGSGRAGRTGARPASSVTDAGT